MGNQSVHLLIAAAGSGRRMGADQNKLLLPLCGRPLLSWTLEAAFAAKSIQWIGIIGQKCDEVVVKALVKSPTKPVEWILGGNTRQESVEKGLEAIPSEANYVLIHDGARCLIDPELFNRCAKEVFKGDAVIAGTPVTDTIKRVNNESYIVETPSREGLYCAQTPQAFPVEQLKRAHQEALTNNWEVTDDAALFEKLNWPVRVIEGSPSNIKVTTPIDLMISEVVLSNRK